MDPKKLEKTRKKAESEGRRMNYNALHILCRNGWKWHSLLSDPLCEDNDEYFCYTNTFLGLYSTKIRACVSTHIKHLCIDGHYGVLWLEAVEYENDPPHSAHDLEDMLYAIELAEDHLLKIGMPFTADYEFRGRNKANKKRRNDKLRRLYNLDELEKEAGYGCI